MACAEYEEQRSGAGLNMLCLGKIKIGEGHTPLVIPDIGINHGGDIEVALAMVNAAHRAGARLVKHQTHVIQDEMSAEAKKVIPGNSDISIYDLMRQCALSEKDERVLFEYVESLGMVYLSTPFSRAAAERLERFGVSAYKIGSGEMNNHPLLDHVASFGKPMIVSTGMNDMEDVRKAVAVLKKRGVPFALMHTTNLYPTPPELVRLGAMRQLMDQFPCIPVGLSDHTLSNAACMAALAMGVKIVERHFTDTLDRRGPDILCSMDETHLRELLVAAKDIPKMLGGEKQRLREEQVTRNFAFATVVTVKPIMRGETFTKDNLWVKRPGICGIPAEDYISLLGKTALCDIREDVHITYEMVENK
jgi:sialic acid synthase SpsE